jgi:hypothetical protein
MVKAAFTFLEQSLSEMLAYWIAEFQNPSDISRIFNSSSHAERICRPSHYLVRPRDRLLGYYQNATKTTHLQEVIVEGRMKLKVAIAI